MLSAVCSALNNAHNDEDDDRHNIDDDGDHDGKIALHLLFGWSLDKDKKSLDQSKQFS